MQITRRRILGLAGAVLTCAFSGCTGPKAPAYLQAHRAETGPVVRVWERRLQGPLRYVASHLILEIRDAGETHELGERWEVFDFCNMRRPELGTIHDSPPQSIDDFGVKMDDARLVAEYRGARAERTAAFIREAVETYKYRMTYVACPGPNSNTFVATLIRECPDMATDLPPTTVGKDFDGWFWAGRTTTKTGVEIETPIVGVGAGLGEGVELHLLGSCLIGFDLVPPAIKLAFVGRLGFPDVSR